MREREFSIYKRLSESWEELKKPFEGAELLTVWVDELDRRLSVDISLPVGLREEGKRREALKVALRVLRAAFKAARAKGVGEVKAFSLRLHSPVCGTVPEEAGLFDISSEKLGGREPQPEEEPERWFDRVWWHPWLLRMSGR